MVRVELLRRQVVRVAVIYGIMGGILLRVPEMLGIPPGNQRWALQVVLLLAAFPVALLLTRLLKQSRSTTGANTPAARTRKLVVLPFKQMRPDSETDFLTFSLADAVTCSLAGLPSLTVMSSAVSSRFAADTPLERVARDAGVDLILTGTMLRNRDELRVTTQLVSMPGAVILDSRTEQLPLDNLFELQDTVARGILRSLSLQGPQEQHALDRDVPASSHAYQSYLRANQLALQNNQWDAAVELYEQSVAEDATYAPAWARLGRAYRLQAKYSVPLAKSAATLRKSQEAFARARELSPELPLIHGLHAQLEVDLGRARSAMVQLLERIRANRGDSELFAALVQACRFAGLVHASVRAHEQARRLDPHAMTGVAHAYFMLGDYKAALANCNPTDIGYTSGLLLAHSGDLDGAMRNLNEVAPLAKGRVITFIRSLRYLLQGKAEESHTTIVTGELPNDAEAVYYLARQEAQTGHVAHALGLLETSARNGYVAAIQLERDPWLASVRSSPAYQQLLQSSRAEYELSLQAYQRAGGVELLGPEPDLGSGPGWGKAAGPTKRSVDVFISYDNADEAFAAQVYDYLTRNGVAVFFAKRSLPELSESDYIRAIHDALERTTHLIVVASTAERAKGEWVRSEWSLFYNEKLSRRKTGNLITCRVTAFPIHDLPIALRANQVIDLNQNGLEQILRYLSNRVHLDEPLKQ